MGDYHPALSEMGVDQIDWWAGRWEAGQSGWHSAAPQPPLVTHLPTLSEGSEGGLRVLVPLCGKAGCLTHLHKAGHDVIGIEGVESVVQEFFSENGLSVIRNDIPGVKGGRYSTPDGRITIFACDLFDVTPRWSAKWMLSGIAGPLLLSALTLGLAMLLSSRLSWGTLSGTFCKPGSMTQTNTLGHRTV